MGKAQRLFEQWTDHIPREARVQHVKTFLDFYFPGMWDHKGSSHMIVRCEALKAFPDYQPYGEISVPVKGGQTVKGFYIKKLLTAVRLLTELGDVS